MLIAKAWGLPQESLQASLDLLAKERQLLRSGSGEDALPTANCWSLRRQNDRRAALGPV